MFFPFSRLRLHQHRIVDSIAFSAALLDVPEIAGESQVGRADTRGEK
jgi:hypothetical protein